MAAISRFLTVPKGRFGSKAAGRGSPFRPLADLGLIRQDEYPV